MPTFAQGLAVFVFGGIGSLLRWLLALGMRAAWPGSTLPFPTLIANIVGCALIGVAMALASRGVLGSLPRIGLVAGLLGGFTTFSAFAFETVELVREGNLPVAIGYVAASVVLGLAAAAAGYAVAPGP
ncbi:MAG: fluoride efflux transporter CrcB [Fimbriimonadaceae bacterium]|nr:fluoride efflux transporter CrcB [Fimbriimonadaceae bacterium]QYK54752.1 MAG: fluoride efflux transporter CrcB [Fimbriimonadaceae bacterium]